MYDIIVEVNNISYWRMIANVYMGYPNSISMRPFGECSKSKTVRVLLKADNIIKFECAPSNSYNYKLPLFLITISRNVEQFLLEPLFVI